MSAFTVIPLEALSQPHRRRSAPPVPSFQPPAPKPKVRVAGMHLEPWRVVPGQPTVKKAIERAESQGWSVGNVRSDGFSALHPNTLKRYDFLMLDGMLHSRPHHRRYGGGGPGKFLCEGCWWWWEEAKRVRVIAGTSLASLHQYEVCLGCINGGILERTAGMGYVARIASEPYA